MNSCSATAYKDLSRKSKEKYRKRALCSPVRIQLYLFASIFWLLFSFISPDISPRFVSERLFACVQERGKKTHYWGFVSLPIFWFIPCFSGSSVPHQPISFALILIYCINDLYYQRIVHIHSSLNHFQIKWFLLGLYINSLYLGPECQWRTLTFRVYMHKEEKIFPFSLFLKSNYFSKSISRH